MSDVDEDAVMSDVDWQEEMHQDGVEEDEKVQLCHLTQETISQGLSLLCRTGNGLGHAFVKLDLKDKGLNDIAAISSYIHLRFLDISNNRLIDLSPLASLIQLLWLKVDNNAVACFKGQPFAQLTYLQWLSMAVNQLTELDGLVGPALESLNLTGNSIKTVKGLQSSCFANLVTLELRGNHLDTTDGINLPNLRRLYLAQNMIKRLEGLEKLERLTTLHLRDNRLDSLEGLSPSMKCLQYLNVRGNAILDENALQHLGLLSKTLRAFVVSENPLVETTDHRLSVLTFVPQLERIDKDPVSPEERSEAWERIKELREEEIPDP
ncbi:leucine-rich repeat-containing protein 23 [Seriola lalandi dorsalis]|uniref:leucine-rich repeat-containing protein 23 n=1 Tax=Seriola lalandi dorsalis TaxID=1841481 RepID=UPI000C6FB676|nr:leucine-rich repeat-containing protein 23 [Seriola lalandi dorsalis]XP_056240287.1 leucine-rich repeat-containing protein 23 [Seriola aureovittata]